MEIELESTNETTNPETASSGDAFLNVFGETSAPDPSPSEGQPQADQQAKPSPEEPSKDTKSSDAQDYTIRHKGEDKVLHLTPDELKNMLQKGYDYDEVRKQRDALKQDAGELDSLRRMRAFYASNNGMTPEELSEYVDSQTTEQGIRTQIEKDNPGLGEEYIAELVEARMGKYKAAQEERAEQEMAAELAAVKAEYPETDLDHLPSKVEAYVQSGKPLLEALRLNELQTLREKAAEQDKRIAALEKEKDNAFRSPGRVESKGAETAADEFISVWGV